MIVTNNFHEMCLFLISYYIDLKVFHQNKFYYENELNIICNAGVINDFDVNKKIHKNIKDII